MSRFLLGPLPSPWPPLTCLPSLWVCLFWTFRINGIVRHVAFVSVLPGTLGLPPPWRVSAVLP